MGHHRFSKITIQVNGKVKGAEAVASEPDENDVKTKVTAALTSLDIGGGYELVDVEIKKYEKTPEKPR